MQTIECPSAKALGYCQERHIPLAGLAECRSSSAPALKRWTSIKRDRRATVSASVENSPALLRWEFRKERGQVSTETKECSAKRVPEGARFSGGLDEEILQAAAVCRSNCFAEIPRHARSFVSSSAALSRQ